MFEIPGKVALITGGASGIGLAIAKELLRNGLKAVTIVDINEALGLKVLDELKKEFGDNKALFLLVDVSDKHKFEEAFETTIQTFQNLDIVINAAGIFDDANWEREIAVNFTGTTNGTVLAFEHYLPKYKTGGEGVILNVASIGAILCNPGIPIYNATKSAIVALTRGFGCKFHYDRNNIKVMAVCPGFTDTRMTNEVVRDAYLGPSYYNSFTETRVNSIWQTSSFVAKAMNLIIEESTNGAVWIVNDNKPSYEVTFPC